MALKPYLGSHFKLEALFLECSLECLWDFSVNTNTTNVIKKFNNSNLGTKSRPDWSKFKTNNTTTNNCQILGNFFKWKSTSRWNNGLVTNYFFSQQPWIPEPSRRSVVARTFKMEKLQGKINRFLFVNLNSATWEWGDFRTSCDKNIFCVDFISWTIWSGSNNLFYSSFIVWCAFYNSMSAGYVMIVLLRNHYATIT